MSSNNKSIFDRLNPYNYKFGTKINILVFALIVISLFASILVSNKYYRSVSKNANLDNIHEINSLKKASIEKDYNAFINKLSNTSFSDLAFYVEQMIQGFNDFQHERTEAFYPDSISIYRRELMNYYQDEFIKSIPWQKPALQDIFPQNDKEIVLQTIYFAKNEYPLEEKYKLEQVLDYTLYSNNHYIIHGEVMKITKEFGFRNVYLIDSKNGDIIYNMNKNVTLGLNMYRSFLNKTVFAATFQKAIMASPGMIISSEFSNFVPSLNQPAAFYALPIMGYDNKVIAVVIAEIGPEFLNKMIFGTSPKDSQVDHVIIGEDLQLRSFPLEQVLYPDKFVQNLKEKARKDVDFQKASLLKTAALNLSFPSDFDILDSEGLKANNYMNESAYLCSTPLNIINHNWYLVSQIETKKVAKNEFSYSLAMGIVFNAVLILSIFLTYLWRKSMVNRLKMLKNGIQKLAEGEKQEEMINKWHDELGESIDTFLELSNRIDEAGKFAHDLSDGKYDSNFDAISENDSFASALNTLKETLKKNKDEENIRAEEDRIRNWTNEGIAMFNDLLRESNNDIKNLAYIIIESLTKYIHSPVGGIYLVDGEEESSKKIKLIAAYAYDRRKQINKVINIGEGIVGNCYLEKKFITLKKIPQDYIEIGSGLGKASPNVLYVIPLLYNDEVLGFLELAAFEELKPYEIEFVEKLAENIAATFSTVRLNSKTAELLDESKRRANEIVQQEEEMRQNMEEMQATQEELARLRDEDEARTKQLQTEIYNSKSMIQQLINSMDGEVIIKDANGLIVLVNEEAAKRFKTAPEKLVGKSDADLYPPDRAEHEAHMDQMALNDGLVSEEITDLVGTEKQAYFVVKKQFYIPTTRQTGIITTRMKR
ncbi:MAG: GAF domain-containing protein [Bacteroidales bacterium]|nr:GAF domain-containing protein [Bacteroidales bacterium]MBN2819288.1 GAF domain-containing protein [Bacteroidales bacterium]